MTTIPINLIDSSIGAFADDDVIETISGFIDVDTLSTLGTLPGVITPRFVTPNCQWIPDTPPTFYQTIQYHPVTPKTVRRVVAELNKLVQLPLNWDSYGGRPVSLHAAYHAAAWLSDVFRPGMPMPHIVPGSDTTVQLEWHQCNLDIEVLFYSSGEVEYDLEDLVTGNRIDGTFPVGKDALSNCMRILTQRAAGSGHRLGL